MGSTLEPDEDVVAGINITPFVDVVLVLLVVFMVTARLDAVANVLPHDLPEARQAQPDIAEFIVTIDAHDRVWLAGEAVLPNDDLRARAESALHATSELRAVIAASAEAHHAAVAAVMEALQRAGVRRIGFAVAPSSEDTP
ncbi:MAG: biopolymer transporter ExbD [Myxococcales bacterium]|nr:biopolymer transporter ExbD [Myxococcales bacterium]